MNRYELDSSGAPICSDCAHGWCTAGGRWCESEHCQCACKLEPLNRAVELDERPAEKLASIARDIEYEARAYPDQLHRERYPDHRELLAERTRRTA